MAALVFRDVSFAFDGGLPILSDVSFRLSPGVYGVTGENGAGKTTLLRLAAREIAPSSGRVLTEPAGSVVVVCPQTADDHGDDVRLLADATTGDALATRDLLGLEPSSLERWETLSYGERRRFQLAAALHRAPDVLLVDEPTNHIDTHARDRLISELRGFRGIALLVSHDRSFLDAVSTATLRVHRGRVAVYDAPYSRACAEWEREAARERDERASRVAERDRAARALAEARDRRARADANRSTRARMKDRNDSDARGLGAKHRVGRAERHLGKLTGARRTELERAERVIPEIEGGKPAGRSVFIGYEPSPRPHVLRLSSPSLTAGDRVILRDVHVDVGRAARVHVRGPNGSGKTTLLRALVESSAMPGQRLLHLAQDMLPGEPERLLAEVRRLPPDARGRALSMVAALGVDPRRLLSSQAPSPGEAKKLALAIALGRRAWALVLDEPTNHLDLPSIERLEAALSEFPGALVLVSHDARFAARLTREAWTLRAGRVEQRT